MIDWDASVAEAVSFRNKGSNLLIAAQIYDAAVRDGGRFTVADLVEPWALSDDEAAELLAAVKEAWAAGRWNEQRGHVGVEEAAAMKINPVVKIRALALNDALNYYRAILRYDPRALDLKIEALYDAHWQAQRLRSVCERDLGTRQR